MKNKICPINYLNALPLVWGLLHGNQKNDVELSFALPSKTAEMIKTGDFDVGILSSIELPRQNLDYVQGLGIASRGKVRSIFLVSQKPLKEIQTLAADSSSRTSVALCRIWLAENVAVKPEIISMKPDLSKMLESADSALIIGDPALHLEPEKLPFIVHDLGEEWTKMTGLPMVYAVWAGRKNALTSSLEKLLFDSYYFGRSHLSDIIETESKPRGFSNSLTQKYLTEHIVYELDSNDVKGLNWFLKRAEDLQLV